MVRRLPVTVNRGLMVTSKSYEEYQRELQRILEVEVPENSKEIGAALELGDLRENAEYKAAKEKQEMLNNTVARLRDEIERAQIFDKSVIDPSKKVSFGTKVTLKKMLKVTRLKNIPFLDPGSQIQKTR